VMPEIVETDILPIYKDYEIAKNIHIIPCQMSSVQWNKYLDVYADERQKDLRRKMYDDDQWHYRTRTRQNCNIVYEDDSFRKKGADSSLKHKAYGTMLENGHLSYDKTLKLYSPKFYEIYKNIQKFIKDDISTGKILYYSTFVQDAGAEIFEKILDANGYERYDYHKKSINELIDQKSKKKRYTFITGDESQDQKRINKESYNNPENIYGEYIQVMIISSSGAEGISLTGVRQVHIMEPFWNFIRIGQVFGRAIRMKSHMELPEDQRNVEQYIYLSFIPYGETIEEIFQSLKDNEWNEVQEIDFTTKEELMKNHNNIFKTIQKILSIKKETNDCTADQLLFNTMEKKNVISNILTDIIKESSVDCIQNTRDDAHLNNRCLRFTEKVLGEETHFPGITSEKLNELDVKQFKSTFQYKVEPNIYVVSAKKNDVDIYVYYEINKSGEEIDVRYIKENGKILCEYDIIRKLFYFYEEKDHELNKLLGTKLSVFQSYYSPSDFIYENKILKKEFPSLDEIKEEKSLQGYIIKYNINETLFYSPKSDTKIITIFEFDKYKENKYSTQFMKPIYIRNKKIFIMKT
jgi:hypothetical protein